MIAANDLRCGDFELVAAGGMESMSQAPYLAPGVRDGLRLGHGKLIDSMIHDGLWDPYDDIHMGNCAELCAARVQVQPRGAGRLRRWRATAAPARPPRSGLLRRGDRAGRDPAEEGRAGRRPRRGAVQGRPRPDGHACKPAFQKDGTVTAANASKINDGAAALVLTTADARRDAWARSRSPASSPRRRCAQKPEWFTTAPVGAVRGGARARRPQGRRHRPLGGQRGLRGGGAGLHARPRDRRRPGQRARRRGGARPSDRRLRRAHPGHPAARAARARRPPRLRRRSASAAARPPRWWWSARLAASHAAARIRVAAPAARSSSALPSWRWQPPATRPCGRLRQAAGSAPAAPTAAAGRRRLRAPPVAREPAPGAPPRHRRRPLRPPARPRSPSTSSSPPSRAAAAPPAAPATSKYERDDYAVLTGGVEIQLPGRRPPGRPGRDRPRDQDRHRRRATSSSTRGRGA